MRLAGEFPKRVFQRPRSRRVAWTGLLVVLSLGTLLAKGDGLPEISLAQFEKSAGRDLWANARFRLNGTILSLSEDRQLVALQDDSGSVVLQCDSIPENAAVGGCLVIEGKGCSVHPNYFSIKINGEALTLDNDGLHPMSFRSVSCDLEAGLQPLQLDWFNKREVGNLVLEFEGPGIPRGPVPSTLFKHFETHEAPAPGLRYQTFIKDSIKKLGDLSGLRPVTEGITPDLRLDILPRRELVGASFRGYLSVPRSGVFTFHLGSDDGSRLVIGHDRVVFEARGGGPVPPRAEEWTGAMPLGNSEWSRASGSVTFASRRNGALVMEVSGATSSYFVTVLDPGELQPAGLLGRRVDLTGVGRSDGIVVVTAGDLSVSRDVAEPGQILTQAVEIRRLQPAEARKPYSARIRGVVTMATVFNELVVQDATGGVYVVYHTPASGIQPRVGEVWEFDGRTDPGKFCPILTNSSATYIGKAAMPKPARPTWDEIAAGNLDSELVEIEGVVVSASTSSMTILLNDGSLHLNDHASYPLPSRALSKGELEALPGSVVKIRGVYKADWDETGRVKSGVCMLGSALMSVDIPAPLDPFAVPAIPISDVLLFTSQTGPFKRIKISGEVLYSRPPVHILNDAGMGFRVWSRSSPKLGVGDRVEVAGFPRLGGAAAAIVEASVRNIGTAALPEPLGVSAEELANVGLDATRVRTEAVVLNDHWREDERLLELQAGPLRYIARMDAADQDTKPLKPGSELQLVGIYSLLSGKRGASAEDFELLVSNAADVVVLRHGPWWTKRHTVATIGILSGGILLTGAWVLLLGRTVRSRTKELARQIENRQIAERRREVQEERTRVAHDLHDELGAGLTEVGMLASMIRSPVVPEPTKEGYLHRLGEVSHGLVTALDEVVWAVNPRYDSVAGLAEYFSLYAQRFLQLSAIRCRPKIDASVAEYPLESHERHDIFLAFKEALNNIVRHSKASEVLLAIDVDDGGLRLRLSDNGQGFDPDVDHPSRSDGLISIKERMARLGGICEITSSPGEGASVEFRLPLERSES